MDKYILFGCGKYSERYFDKIEKLIPVEVVCDNDPKLHGKLWKNKYLCIAPGDMKKYEKDTVLISVESQDTYYAIAEQMKALGMRSMHINEVLCQKWLGQGLEIIHDELLKFLNSKKKRILLLGAPAHQNLGDQAQSYCTKALIEEQFDDCEVFIFEGNLLRKDYYFLLYLIRNAVGKEDIVLVHSGYHCTDIFQKEEDLNEKIVQMFPKKRLLFLPQTVFFKTDAARKRSQEIFNSHDNLTILCRDKTSYELAESYYTNCTVLLYPDIVTSLIGRREYGFERKGILLCLRGSKNEESGLDSATQQNLARMLSKLDDMDICDTDSDIPWRKIRENREKVIELTLEKYAKYRVVITDRFHGMIFALIANTPVIVLPSTDHKISSGIKWFDKSEFKDLYLTGSIEKAVGYAEEILRDKHEAHLNPKILYNKYYKNFSIIKEMCDE